MGLRHKRMELSEGDCWGTDFLSVDSHRQKLGPVLTARETVFLCSGG